MKREFLEGLGIEKDVINQIMAEHGKSVTAEKAKAAELQSTNTDLQNQLDQRDADLKKLRKDAEGNGDLQKQYEELQKQYKLDKAEADSKLKALQINTALKLAVAGKVHDADLVASLIDTQKVELAEDGTVKGGLDEQLNTLKESKAFLFVPEKEDPQIPKGTKPPGEGATPPGGTSIASEFAQAANARSEVPTESKSIWG